MIRIPYPIPDYDRARLIRAGQAACAAFQLGDRSVYKVARRSVDAVIAEITTKYGEEQA